MVGPLKSPIFQQPRYMQPGTQIMVSMTKSLPEFALECKDKTKVGVTGVPYKFSISAMTLYINAIGVHTDIVRHHQMLLAKGSHALYPMTDVICRISQIPIGASYYLTDQLVAESLPSHCILMIVDSEAYFGSLNTSPFNCKPHGLELITVRYKHSIVRKDS